MKQITIDDKLKYIYEKVADKKLKFWSKFINKLNPDKIETCISKIRWGNFYASYEEDLSLWTEIKVHFPHTIQVKEVIGAEVMLWDVLDYLEKNNLMNREDLERILLLWVRKREKIDEQNFKLIDIVYDILTREE